MKRDITLTSKQIKEMSEISLDKRAAEATLKIALTHHANTLNSVHKQESAWWKEVMEIHGLDGDKEWCIKEERVLEKCDRDS